MGNGTGSRDIHMTEAFYWIWLQQAFGIGSWKIDRVIEMVPDLLDRVEKFFDKKEEKDLGE